MERAELKPAEHLNSKEAVESPEEERYSPEPPS